MARKREEDALETRRMIIEAALDLFSEQGYSKTSFSAIGKRVGMTRGAVHHHFSSKEELLGELMKMIQQRREALVDLKLPFLGTLADSRSRFLLHARVVFEDEMIRKFEFFMVYQMEWSSELMSEMVKVMNGVGRAPIAQIRKRMRVLRDKGFLRADVNIDVLSLTVASLWDGAVNLHLVNAELEETPASDEEFLEQLGAGFDLIMSSVITKEQ